MADLVRHGAGHQDSLRLELHAQGGVVPPDHSSLRPYGSVKALFRPHAVHELLVVVEGGNGSATWYRNEQDTSPPPLEEAGNRWGSVHQFSAQGNT